MADLQAGDARRVGTTLRNSAQQAQLAAFHLFKTNPEASAGRRLAPPLPLVLGPVAFLLGLLVLAPVPTLLGLVTLTYGYIAALSALRLAAGLSGPCHARRICLDDSQLPRMSVIVALYQESEVVAGLCAGLSRLKYPRDRLDVLLVLEQDDEDTITAARAAARRRGFKVLVVPPCGPRTKPRALNYALQEARGEFVAVYDAEDAPRTDQLYAAAESFAANARLGVVQAPLGWYNATDNWLTRQFALEYAAQFHSLLPLFVRLGVPLPLGGTSNVFRVSALKAVGGWDPHNVTEDADLGFRLARHGWEAGLIEPGTAEEAPTTLKSWTGQRSRWLKGHLVTWLVQMRRPRALIDRCGWRGLAALQLSLFANVFSALFQLPGLLMLGIGLLGLAIGHAHPVTLSGLALALMAWSCALICLQLSARRASVKVHVRDLVSAPLYWLCQLPAAWRALNELGGAPYVWVKTRHGVSTTRREAPDEPDCDLDPDGMHRRAVRPERLAVRSSP